MKYNIAIVRAYFRGEGIPPFVTEHVFHPDRKWRFDFAWLDSRVALEVEGGRWVGGGHNRGKGFSKDVEKYNQAQLLGWRVFRCEPSKLCMSETVQMIRKALTQ